MLCAILAGAAPSPSPAHPATMLRIQVTNVSPDVPRDSFAAQPRTLFRAGDGFCRVDEADDATRGIHASLIVNEPDAWFVNWTDKTARHSVDPGPTFKCHLPIFATPPVAGHTSDVPAELATLEFGRELEFAKAQHAKTKSGPPMVADKPTVEYYLDFGDQQLTLLVDPDVAGKERLFAISFGRPHHESVYLYNQVDTYPFDPKEFSQPAGIKMKP